MQRELKFRAWDKTNKCFPFKEFSIIGEVTAFDLLKQYQTKNIVDLEVTQYIGVKDSKGKEIYEGDILNNDAWKVSGVVFFDRDYFNGWAVRTGDDDITDLRNLGEVNRAINPIVNGAQCTDECSIEDCIVIGNIYETPELIPTTAPDFDEELDDDEDFLDEVNKILSEE